MNHLEENSLGSHGASTGFGASTDGFPANITAACNAADAMHIISKSKPTALDTRKVERRRTVNRLSARRWRSKKKRTFADLQDQISILRRQYVELELEKSNLQAELTMELQLAKAASTRAAFLSSLSSLSSSSSHQSRISLTHQRYAHLQPTPNAMVDPQWPISRVAITYPMFAPFPPPSMMMDRHTTPLLPITKESPAHDDEKLKSVATVTSNPLIHHTSPFSAFLCTCRETPKG